MLFRADFQGFCESLDRVSLDLTSREDVDVRQAIAVVVVSLGVLRRVLVLAAGLVLLLLVTAPTGDARSGTDGSSAAEGEMGDGLKTVHRRSA